MQVTCYMCTLVCLGVVTLEQCLLAAAPALSKGIFAKMGDINASGIKHAILAALRDWLYARAVGQDAPLLGSCPALHAEACFDAGCPLAASVGLKMVSMFSHACRMASADQHDGSAVHCMRHASCRVRWQ